MYQIWANRQSSHQQGYLIYVYYLLVTTNYNIAHIKRIVELIKKKRNVKRNKRKNKKVVWVKNATGIKRSVCVREREGERECVCALKSIDACVLALADPWLVGNCVNGNAQEHTFLSQGETTLIEISFERTSSMFGHILIYRFFTSVVILPPFRMFFCLYPLLHSIRKEIAQHKFQCMPCFCYHIRFELLVFLWCFEWYVHFFQFLLFSEIGLTSVCVQEKIKFSKMTIFSQRHLVCR